MLQSVRLPRSSGGPRGLPLGPCRLEARLAACVERDQLGWTRHRFGACRDPYEMKMHLGSSLSLKGARGALVLESAACEVGDQLRRRGG